MTASLAPSIKADSRIPRWVGWVQCIAFVALYAVWILPEVVGIRNTALVIGALFGSYSIFQYRDFFKKKSALPIWLIFALFGWATFHLFFLSSDFQPQYVEYLRIWKYAAIGALMSVGLGLSLTNFDSQDSNRYWPLIYFGLCAPLLIFLGKFLFTSYGKAYGVEFPASMLLYGSSSVAEVSNRFYVPKTDYVAFCLPALSVALGLLLKLFGIQGPWRPGNFLNLIVQISVIIGTLFLFGIQNIKNGLAYAVILFIIFGASLIFYKGVRITWKKLLTALIIMSALLSAIAFNIKKNDSWRTLIADIKVAVQVEKYPHWKDASKYGYPLNEYGTSVSATNYERAAWGYIGAKLSLENPLGYGLVEDSFARMAKNRWPESGKNLSHSHSGWLDVILAIGYPGFFLIISALLLAIKQACSVAKPWGDIAFWPLLANLLLWCTTEVSATVTFAALIFWICFSAGLGLVQGGRAVEGIKY